MILVIIIIVKKLEIYYKLMFMYGNNVQIFQRINAHNMI